MGLSPIDMLRLQWQLTSGRYQGVLVETEAMRQQCQVLLDAVRGDELKRDHYALDAPLIRPGHVSDDGIIAVVDTRDDRVVGVLRATRMSLVARRPELAPDFQFDPAVLGDLADTAFLCHRLVIDPAHRKTAASLVLMRTVYALGVEHRGRMCLLDCEPPIARIYRRLGFLPIGRPYTRDGVLFIAMVLVNNDVAHLRRVRSPLLRAWRAMGRPRDVEGPAWVARLTAEGTLPSRDFEYVPSDTPVDGPLFEGVSASARAALLANATRLRLAPGQVVMRRGDVGTWFGLLERGRLEARLDGRLTTRLGAGDIVGELACVRRGRRATDVVTGPDGATLLMLSAGAFRRVKGARDRERLWANVARMIAERLSRSLASMRAPVEPVSRTPARRAVRAERSSTSRGEAQRRASHPADATHPASAGVPALWTL